MVTRKTRASHWTSIFLPLAAGLAVLVVLAGGSLLKVSHRHSVPPWHAELVKPNPPVGTSVAAAESTRLSPRRAEAHVPSTAQVPPPLQTSSTPLLRENDRARLLESYGKLPLSFEANQGQTDARVKFLSRGGGYTMFLTSSEAVFALRRPPRSEATPSDSSAHSSSGLGNGGTVASLGAIDSRAEIEKHRAEIEAIGMKLLGANPQAEIAGASELPGRVSYFIGNDPSKWVRSVPTYAQVKYRGIYPGIDLLYYGNEQQLENDLLVAPGADPAQIRLQFEGAQRLGVSPEGDLILNTTTGELRLLKPRVYQEIAGARRDISAKYVLSAERSVSFSLGDYDHAAPLVIDPVLVYSTYLNGGGFYAENSNSTRLHHGGHGIAVDAAGSAYVTGETDYSLLLPTPGALTSTFGFLFVAKLNPNGTGLDYVAVFGTGCGEYTTALTVDAQGEAVVTGTTNGQTTSCHFPTTPDALEPGGIGTLEPFVTKLDATGSSLLYSTYLALTNAGQGFGTGVAIDAGGSIYVTGSTYISITPVAGIIPGFPPSNGLYGIPLPHCLVLYTTCNSVVFAVKLDPSQALFANHGLIFNVILGGSSNEDYGQGIAVDGGGAVYVVGSTYSADFPMTPQSIPAGFPGGFQTTFVGPTSCFSVQPSSPTCVGNVSDVFVTKLNPQGNGMLYSTYLGQGDGWDIAVDAQGDAYVTGDTNDPLFPATSGAYQTTIVTSSSLTGSPPFHAFVTKLNPAGTGLVYSTFLGGSGYEDNCYPRQDCDPTGSIAVDTLGNAYVSGFTASNDFPVVNPVQPQAILGQTAAFVSQLDPSGSTLVSSTRLASGGTESFGIAIDPAGSAYVMGTDRSRSFPTTTGALEPTYNSSDFYLPIFVAKLARGTGSADVALTMTDLPNPVVAGSNLTYTLTVTNNGPADATGVTVSDPLPYVPSTVSFISATASQGTCTPPSLSPTGNLICSLGTVTNGGSATVTIVVTPAGPGTLTNAATVSLDQNDPNTANNVATVTTTVAASTVVTVNVTSSANPSVFGQQVSFTATATPPSSSTQTPTGNVTFNDGATVLGVAALSAGTAVYNTATLTVGAHSITASYSGDSNFGSSTSKAVGQTVNQASTTTALAASPNPSNSGQSVTLIATVAAVAPSSGTPTGSVTFLDGATTLGTGTLNSSGTATFSTSALTPGSHSLTASYAGDTNFTSSTSTAVSQPVSVSITVNESISVSDVPALLPSAMITVPESISVTDSPGVFPPAVITVNESISVSDVPTVGNTPVGTIIGVVPIDTTTGTSPISVTFDAVTQAGITSLTISNADALSPAGFQPGKPSVYYDISTSATYSGAVSICINYSGVSFTQPPQLFHYQNGAWVNVTTSVDTTNMIVCGTTNSFSPFALFQPGAYPTTTSISGPGVAYGTLANVTVSVGSSGGPATGNVTLSVDGGGASTMALSNGSASFSLGALSAGSHSLSANFAAQGNFLASSAVGTLSVTQVPLMIAANNAARRYGANNPVLTGTIAGLQNADPITASFITTATPASSMGAYPITPVVLDAQNFLSNYSLTLVNGTLTVIPEATSLSIAISPSSIPVGQSTAISVTLNAPDMVVPIDPSVLAPITVSSPIVSDILTNNGTCTPVPAAAPGIATCTITLTAVEPNGRTLNASFPGSSALVASTGKADLVVTAPLESKVSCLKSDFRNVAVPGGSYLWFNSIFKARDVSKQKVTLTFFQSSVQFQYTDAGGNLVKVNQPMPDAKIVIDPSVTSASTTFDAVDNVWLTTVPFDLDDAIFLTGIPWLVPAGGIPGDIEPVTWCGTFASDTADIDIGWRWAAAAYSSFSGDNTTLGVKPMDTDHDNSSSNHDRAGTPENFKTFVIPGARGKGGKNYTGSYSGSAEIE